MYPIMLHRLVPVIGFGWAVRVLGFLLLFFGVVSAATLRNRRSAKTERKLFPAEFFYDKPMLLYTIALFLVLIALYVPAVYISTFGLHYHIVGSNLAFYLLPILQTSNIMGRIVLTFFADFTGPLNMRIPAACAVSVLTFAWIAVRNEAGLITFAILYGIFLGTVQALGPPCVASVTKDMTLLGTNMVSPF